MRLILILGLSLFLIQIHQTSGQQWLSLHYESQRSFENLIFAFDQNDQPVFYVRSYSGDVYVIDIYEGRKKLFHAVKDTNYFAEKVTFLALAGEAHLLFGIVDIQNVIYSMDVNSQQFLLPPWTAKTTVSIFNNEVPKVVYPINTASGTQLLIATEGGAPNLYLYDPSGRSITQQFRSTSTTCGSPTMVLMGEAPLNKNKPDYYVITYSCIIRWRFGGSAYTQAVIQTTGLLDDIVATLYNFGEKTYLIYGGWVRGSSSSRVYVYDTSTGSSPVYFNYATPGASTAAAAAALDCMTLAQTSEANDVVVIGIQNGDVLTCSLTKYIKQGTFSCQSIIPSFEPPTTVDSGVLALKFGLILTEVNPIFSVIIVRRNGNVHLYNFNTLTFTQLASSSDWPYYVISSYAKHISFVRLSKGDFTGRMAIAHNGNLYVMQNTEVSSAYQFLNYDADQSSSRHAKILMENDISITTKGPSQAVNLGVLSYNQIETFIDQFVQLKITLTSSCSSQQTLVYTVVGYDANSQVNRFDSLKVIAIQNGVTEYLLYSSLAKQPISSSCNYLWTSTFIVD